MPAHLTKKTSTQLLLLLSLVAIILLASGLSEVELKPGRSVVLGSSEEILGADTEEATIVITPEMVVAVVAICAICLWLIALFIRLFHGKKAIKEDLLTLFFLALFTFLVTWSLTEAVSQIDPRDLPQGQQEEPPIDIAAFAEGAEEVNRESIPEPSDWIVIVISGGVGLALAGTGYFVYRRFFNRPAAATLAQLALDAEATLLKLQVEDANLRDVVMRSYFDMSKTVSEQGVHRTEGMTPREFEERLITAGLPRRDVERLTRLFEEVRYGHVTAGERQKREAIACMQAIVAAAQQRAAAVNYKSSPLPGNRPI